ncbi:MAG: hypothetical protein EAZ37_15370 [Burkholderiales bacterium]|nr:MAG: hypothetical protein EAZ37_15370 [Burkholderiales bacterium]
MPSISYDDLETAFNCVCGSVQFDNSAYISKTTGEIFHASQTYDSDENLPEDCEDESLYWSVPHKNELDLGRDLVLQFVDGFLPEQYDAVQAIFHKRGAYGRFKDLLLHQGKLEEWFEYESTHTKKTLLAWAQEHQIDVKQGE